MQRGSCGWRGGHIARRRRRSEGHKGRGSRHGKAAGLKVGVCCRVPECGLVGSELRALVLQVSHEDDLLLLWRWAALNAALRRCLCADPLE